VGLSDELDVRVDADHSNDVDALREDPAPELRTEPVGVLGRSMSPSSSGSSSSSVLGKKLRKSASACHLLEFLNSIQTSMRPGRESAGSSFSRWLVVLWGLSAS
jgi:hypothetical protein